MEHSMFVCETAAHDLQSAVGSETFARFLTLPLLRVYRHSRTAAWGCRSRKGMAIMVATTASRARWAAAAWCLCPAPWACPRPPR